MKKLAKFSLRILSIYFLADFFIVWFPSILQVFISGGLGRSRNELILMFVHHLLKLAVALILWIFANQISVVMVGKDNLKFTEEINYERLYILAFSVLGIIILSRNIPLLIHHILGVFFNTFGQTLIPQRLTASIIRSIIGLLLILKSKNITNFIEEV